MSGRSGWCGARASESSTGVTSCRRDAGLSGKSTGATGGPLLKRPGRPYISAMPFDMHDRSPLSRADRASTEPNRRLVAAWLFSVAGMIMVMIVLGGATRLTGSGLSIMEWDPLMGAIPPLSDAEWQRLFALYQKIPQYALVNAGFGIDGFKHIFWLEWFHRLWGRLIGLVFFVPLLWFLCTARIERRLIPRLVGLFALGGLQGAVGWFMVASGFMADSTAVSPYRLVIHLGLALTLYGAIVWTGLSVINPRPLPGAMSGAASGAAFGVERLLARLCLALVCLTIVAGGFVAGLHAGLTYNSFPLMDGRLVPDGYGLLRPFWRNWTENVAAAQFDHRLLATLTVAMVAILAIRASRAGLPAFIRYSLAGAVLLQYGLGVATLLMVVPVPLAVLHQAGAVILLTAVLVTLHALRRGPSVGAPTLAPIG